MKSLSLQKLMRKRQGQREKTVFPTSGFLYPEKVGSACVNHHDFEKLPAVS